MEDPTLLPKCILKAGGRLEPFDGDRISRALFAATRQLGRSDPFLARELTDGVLHFLAAEDAADPIPVGEVIETTVKVIRELGHPVIARAFGEQCATKVAKPGQSDDWPPDLRAAEQNGLLRLPDVAIAMRIEGMVLPPTANGWIDSVIAARDHVSQFVAIDGPEYLLSSSSTATRWVGALTAAVRATGLRAVVNLNSAEAPPWAVTDRGPLFGPGQVEDTRHRRQIAETIADRLLSTPETGISVEWHLSEIDFEPANREHLMQLSRHVAGAAPIVFAAHRPRRAVTLGDGLDRENPAVLATVGIGLPRLLEIARQGAAPDAGDLLAKLGSLARLALSAGRFRRRVIRRHEPSTTSAGFLADRAHLVIAPLGLEKVVRQVTGQHWTAGRGLDFAKDVLLSLNAALLRDAGRLRAMVGRPSGLQDPVQSSTDVIAPRQQLRGAAILHTAVGSGMTVVQLGTDCLQPADIVDLLEFAWRLPGLARFALTPLKRQLRQMTAAW